MPLESAAIVARLVRALCAESCCKPGRGRCVRDEARPVMCGVSHAAAVLASEDARRAIAHGSARRAGRVPIGATAGPECHVRYP